MGQLSKKNKKFNKNKQLFSLPIIFEQEETDSDGLLKLKLYFITVGKNPNKTNFSKESIDNAKNSLSNKPILAYIQNKDTDNEDFKAHEIEYQVDDDGEVTIKYLEQPIGTIPETNDFHYEELNGLTYGVCNAYVWEDYCSNAGDILKTNGTQNLSMEISVEDCETKEGITDITEFTYSGITMLSNKIPTGIEGAHADVVNFALDIKEEFFDRVKELNESLKIKFSKADNDINNKKEEEGIMLKTKKEIALSFSLTMEQLEDELNRLLCQITYTGEDWWGDECQCRKYSCLIDYDEVEAYVADREQGFYVGIPYSKNGDDIVLDYEKTSRIKFSPIPWEGATPKGDEPIEDDSMMKSMDEMQMSLKDQYMAKVDSIVSTKVNEAVTAKETEFNITLENTKTDYEAKLTEKDTKINNLTEEFNTVNSEVETLKAYKLQKDTDEKEALFADYSEELTEEEMKPVKDKIAEFSLKEAETELKLIFANKNHKPNIKSLPKYNKMGVEDFNWNNDDSKSETNEDVWTRLEKNKKN